MAINYKTAFTNTNNIAFPDTEAVNASGPTATDGTEFVKILIDDHWGARQALMNYAGLVPDGISEADGTAQMIEVLQKGFGAPPGIITEWALALDPAVSGHRSILLQGQGVLRASFPDLDSAVYVGDGNNAPVAAGGGAFYRADDAAGVTPNIVGIYLILPDARGVVPRGLDVAAAIDPDGASRFLGDLQADDFESHTHAWGGDVVALASGGTSVERSSGSPTSPTSATGGAETRMYNRSTTYVIWY